MTFLSWLKSVEDVISHIFATRTSWTRKKTVGSAKKRSLLVYGVAKTAKPVCLCLLRARTSFSSVCLDFVSLCVCVFCFRRARCVLFSCRAATRGHYVPIILVCFYIGKREITNLVYIFPTQHFSVPVLPSFRGVWALHITPVPVPVPHRDN